MNIKFMKVALEEARKAYEMEEVPIGAVIVKNNEIIARGYNKKNKLNNVLKHAEIIAIEKAQKKIGNWRLDDCDIYITLEPCPMCASAIQQSRIKNVYYGIENLDENNHEIVNKIFAKTNTNKKVNYMYGFCADEVKEIMQRFFENKR